MFYDVHVHARDVQVPGTVGPLPSQLIEQYDELKIEKGVLLPIVSPEVFSSPQSNEEVLAICARYPERLIPFCCLDARACGNSASANFTDILAYYKDKGCKGVVEVTVNLPFLHPMVQNMFKHIEAAGLPLLFHIAAEVGGLYGMVDDPGLPQLEQSLRNFPTLKFFGHSQAFWAEMGPLRDVRDRYHYPNYPVTSDGAIPKLFRNYPNLYGDLSAGSGYNALARDRKFGVDFLNEFQDRLFFGTDICSAKMNVALIPYLLELRETGEISEGVFAKIAKENLKRVLGI